MTGSDAFKRTIRDYLETRGSKDPLFARIVLKPGKNIDDCITYILNTVKSSGCNGFTDDEVYSMAIHYFDEDNINAGGAIKGDVVVNHKVELTEEEKLEARKKAFDELVAEHKAKVKAKKKVEPIKKDDKDALKSSEKSLFIS